MKDNIQDTAHKLFFEICTKNPMDIDMFFLDHLNFPRIDYEPITTIYFPLPREVNGIQVMNGSIFTSLEESKVTIFSLFFASVCHAAGHAEITDFNKYKKWMNGKNKKRAFETFEFIEDVRVDEFLKNTHPQYHAGIKKIEEIFNKLYDETTSKDIQKNAKKIFSNTFVTDIKLQRDEIKKKILALEPNDDKGFIEIADAIYDSSNILTDQTFPFREHYSHPKRIEKWRKDLTINTEDTFQETAEMLGGIWDEQLKRRAKVRKKYGGITEDLEFDRIDFAPENIGEYLRLKNATHLFLKKMSAQMKMTPNVMDEGMPEDMGLLEMQAAIQAVAAQNNSIQIFEQDDYRRIEEEWAIVVDTSSSMRLKFDEMKKFAICLGEAANEVNSKNGKWGFFTFNNNFTIVKDHYENYDQFSKSRIGGIEVSGLSFISDAVKLCSRILHRENIERRYIFLVTDGQALGTYEADTKMREAIEDARKKGISVVAIGMPQGVTKIFSLCMPYEGLRKTVAKFLGAYTLLAGDDM